MLLVADRTLLCVAPNQSTTFGSHIALLQQTCKSSAYQPPPDAAAAVTPPPSPPPPPASSTPSTPFVVDVAVAACSTPLPSTINRQITCSQQYSRRAARKSACVESNARARALTRLLYYANRLAITLMYWHQMYVARRARRSCWETDAQLQCVLCARAQTIYVEQTTRTTTPTKHIDTTHSCCTAHNDTTRLRFLYRVGDRKNRAQHIAHNTIVHARITSSLVCARRAQKLDVDDDDDDYDDESPPCVTPISITSTQATSVVVAVGNVGVGGGFRVVLYALSMFSCHPHAQRRLRLYNSATRTHTPRTQSHSQTNLCWVLQANADESNTSFYVLLGRKITTGKRN